MTFQQEEELKKACKGINQVRKILDHVMYGMTPLEEVEQRKIRQSYELICEAHDKLF